MSLLLVLAAAAATAVAPALPARTATFTVRARVEAVCDLSRLTAACRGAANAAPLARRVEDDGGGRRRLTIEF